MRGKLLILVGFTALALSGCCMQHSWTEATCTEPKTCKVCNTTEGETLEHDWTEATCTARKSCKLCGAKDGEALGHEYVNNACIRCEDKLIESFPGFEV